MAAESCSRHTHMTVLKHVKKYQRDLPAGFISVVSATDLQQ